MNEAAVKKLVIVWYSYTGGSKALAQAAKEAALAHGDGKVDVTMIAAQDAQADVMLDADGYIFAFPENLAAIAGEMKAFFDRCYYPCLERIEGRPYAMLICAGSDGQNALQQAERIATGWRLKKAVESQIICTHAQSEREILAPKNIPDADLARAAQTGGALSAGLALGVL